MTTKTRGRPRTINHEQVHALALGGVAVADIARTVCATSRAIRGILAKMPPRARLAVEVAQVALRAAQVDTRASHRLFALASDLTRTAAPTPPPGAR